MHFQICGNNDGNIIHVFKNCISISVATVLEVFKMTVPICTSHWCLVMRFWLKVCIYSRSLPSAPLKLAQAFTSSCIHISLCNIRQFSFICCLLLMIALFFHMHIQVVMPLWRKRTHTHTHTLSATTNSLGLKDIFLHYLQVIKSTEEQHLTQLAD